MDLSHLFSAVFGTSAVVAPKSIAMECSAPLYIGTPENNFYSKKILKISGSPAGIGNWLAYIYNKEPVERHGNKVLQYMPDGYLVKDASTAHLIYTMESVLKEKGLQDGGLNQWQLVEYTATIQKLKSFLPESPKLASCCPGAMPG